LFARLQMVAQKCARPDDDDDDADDAAAAAAAAAADDDDDDDDDWWLQVMTLKDFFMDEFVFVAFAAEKFSPDQLTLSDEG